MNGFKSNLNSQEKKILSRKSMATESLKLQDLRIDGNPESHSSTVNIFLFPVNKIHWDIKSIINILLKPALKKRKEKRSYKTNSMQ